MLTSTDTLQPANRARWGHYTIRSTNADIEIVTEDPDVEHDDEDDRMTFRLHHEGRHHDRNTGFHNGLNTIILAEDTICLAMGNFQLSALDTEEIGVDLARGVLTIPDLDGEKLEDGQHRSLLLFFPADTGDATSGRFVIDDNVTVSSTVFGDVLEEAEKSVDGIDFYLTIRSDLMNEGEQELTARYLPGVEHFFSRPQDQSSPKIIRAMYSPLLEDSQGRIPVTEIEDDGTKCLRWDAT